MPGSGGGGQHSPYSAFLSKWLPPSVLRGPVKQGAFCPQQRRQALRVGAGWTGALGREVAHRPGFLSPSAQWRYPPGLPGTWMGSEPGGPYLLLMLSQLETGDDSTFIHPESRLPLLNGLHPKGVCRFCSGCVSGATCRAGTRNRQARHQARSLRSTVGVQKGSTHSCLEPGMGVGDLESAQQPARWPRASGPRRVQVQGPKTRPFLSSHLHLGADLGRGPK